MKPPKLELVMHGGGITTKLPPQEISELVIYKNGEAQFGLTIQPDGRLVFMEHTNLVYHMRVPQGVTLYPGRPWKRKKRDPK